GNSRLAQTLTSLVSDKQTYQQLKKNSQFRGSATKIEKAISFAAQKFCCSSRDDIFHHWEAATVARGYESPNQPSAASYSLQPCQCAWDDQKAAHVYLVECPIKTVLSQDSLPLVASSFAFNLKKPNLNVGTFLLAQQARTHTPPPRNARGYGNAT